MRNLAGPKPPKDDPFEKRASRAEALSKESSVAAEPLAFAARLFRFQGHEAAALVARHRDAPFSGRAEEDLGRFLDLLPRLCDLAAKSGPPELAELATARRQDDEKTAGSRLFVFWSGEPEAREDFLSRAFLRPYVEVLRGLSISPERSRRDGHCPFCGAPPIVGFRRAEPESQGAARWLCCGLCGEQWLFARIRCPSCGEADPTKLPSFQGEPYPGVRIEACETCRRYLKSIDLTIDARPIPEVDDLVSVAMDLWAIEEGYARIEPGWAGL